MGNRIRQLREKRGLTQETLAIELEITQQQLSKYEKDIESVKVETLKKTAAYFNVTTDYLLEISDIKRDMVGAIEMSKTLEEYYDLVELYKGLEQCDQEMVLAIVAIIRKNASFRKKREKL